MTSEPVQKIIYGIWIPRRGWWKAKNPEGTMEAYAETRFFVALRYALWIGSFARVEVVDPALVAAEQDLIDCEDRPRKWIGEIWRTLRSLTARTKKQ